MPAPISRRRRRALASILVVACCALPAAVPVAQGMPAAASAATAPHHRHHAKARRHAKSCPRGTVRLQAHGHRRCAKARLPHPPSTSSPVLPALTAGMLHAAAHVRTRHGRLTVHVPKAVLRALAPARALLTTLAAGGTTGTQASAARHVAAHAAIDPGVLDHPPQGSPTDALEQAGWKVETHPDPQAPSVTISKDGQSITQREGTRASAADCPDAKGDDAGSSPVIFDIDLQVPVGASYHAPEGLNGTPATQFIHVQSDLTSRTVSHDSEDAHLVDFDVRGKYIMNIQVGLKDAAGRVLMTNEPTLATIHFDATHIKPLATGGDPKAWVRSLLAHTTYSAVFTNIADQAGTLAQALMSWAFAAIGANESYRDIESTHWQKDCLDITATADKQQLHWNEHGTVTITGVTARGGKLATPVPLKLTPDNGTLTPGTAAFNGVPVVLDFTRGTDGAGSGVTIAATSRMGVGQAEVRFGDAPVQREVRFTSDVTETFDGGDHGTGTGSWSVAADVPLSDYGGNDKTGPIPPNGSAPLAFTTFSYARHGARGYCQDGLAATEDFDGTTTDPGTLIVHSADASTGQSGLEAEVDFEVTPPVEHYVETFNHGASTCLDATYDLTSSWWAASLSSLGYPAIPGVSLSHPSPGHTVYAITGGWQPGTGDVAAYRDLTFTHTDPYGPMQAHIRVEVIVRH